MNSELPDLISRTVLTILGGLISGAIGIWVANHGRKKEACAQFLITMSELHREALQNRDFAGFHKETLGRFANAVFRLRPFLSKQKADNLDFIWTKYQQIDAESLERRNERDWVAELYATFGERPPTKPSKIITFFIEKLCAIAR